MKKLTLIAAVLAVLLISCDNGNGDTNGDTTQTVATPVANPAAGVVESGTTVALLCATDGAVIRYTLDGGNPTASSPLYGDPIEITQPVTIRAIAFKDGWNNSEMLTAAYTIKIDGGHDPCTDPDCPECNGEDDPGHDPNDPDCTCVECNPGNGHDPNDPDCTCEECKPTNPGDENIAIGNFTATLSGNTLVIPNYVDPATIGPITLSQGDKAKLAGKSLVVDIQK